MTQRGKPGLVGTAGGSSTTPAPLDGSKMSSNNLVIPCKSFFILQVSHALCQYFICWLELPLNDANVAYFNVFRVTDFVLY